MARPATAAQPAVRVQGTDRGAVAEGTLHPECRKIFSVGKTPKPSSVGMPLRLHRHQADAIRTAAGGSSYLLTTGTGLGKSFLWDAERRELIGAELDGAMPHLYGLDRSDAEHVLDSFEVARTYDEAERGELRTKRLVLERYDAFTEATASGVPYETVFNPPPGDPRATHAALARQPAGRAGR